MKAIAATLVLFSVTPAVAQQCGKGQMPGPPGSGQCIQVCGPGYSIGKDASGFNTCLCDGNAAVGPHHAKYAFLSLAAGKDDICFGIRADERVETVVDDHFIDVDWHVQPKHAYVAEISYTLDPGLTKLHLTGVRYWRGDANGKPVGETDLEPASAEVPLYDAPQPNWPCTKQQWAAIMNPPTIVSAPPGQSGGGENDIGKSIANSVHQQTVREQQNRIICGNPRGCF